MIRLRLKGSKNLISLVENMGTGENLPVGKKVKFEPWFVVFITTVNGNSRFIDEPWRKVMSASSNLTDNKGKHYLLLIKPGYTYVSPVD